MFSIWMLEATQARFQMLSLSEMCQFAMLYESNASEHSSFLNILHCDILQKVIYFWTSPHFAIEQQKPVNVWLVVL